MYIRADTIIPISAALVGKGVGLGTVLAFIIGGAGASIPKLIILGSMFKMFGILMAGPVGKYTQLACRAGLIEKQLRRCNLSLFEKIG
jgi:hypothetical protein